MSEERQPIINIRLLANGYLITGQAATGIEPPQWVARDIDEVCSVLHKVLAKPEPQP